MNKLLPGDPGTMPVPAEAPADDDIVKGLPTDTFQLHQVMSELARAMRLHHAGTALMDDATYQRNLKTQLTIMGLVNKTTAGPRTSNPVKKAAKEKPAVKTLDDLL